MATASQSRSLAAEAYYPDPKRRRVQKSEADSYDGPEDKLSLLAHTYEQDRVGCPPLLVLPLVNYELQQSEDDKMHEIYRKYRNPQLQDDILQVLQYVSLRFIPTFMLLYIDISPESTIYRLSRETFTCVPNPKEPYLSP